jgi:hypothetical protein
MTDCELTNLRTENKLLAEELEKHREAIRRLADQDATLSVCDGNVTVTMDATLTDEEREAIDRVAFWLDQHGWRKDVDTLLALLERTK